MKHTKEQLIENAKVYFDNPEVNSIIATEDGQYFFPRDINHAKNHAYTKKGIEVIEISREDVYPTEEKKSEFQLKLESLGKDELKKLGKDLDPIVKLTKNMSIDTMIEKLLAGGLADEKGEE